MIEQKTVVIGIGRCGCKAIYDFSLHNNYSNVDILLIDSDLELLSSLSDSKNAERINVGGKETNGKGCGGNFEAANKLILAYKESIMEKIAPYSRIIFFGGLGGGFGSALMSQMAMWTYQSEKTIIFVAALPFDIEGVRKNKLAVEIAQKIINYSCNLVQLKHSLVYSNLENVDAAISFDKTDKYFAKGIAALVDLFRQSNDQIRIEFEVLRETIKKKGTTCSLSYGYKKTKLENEEDLNAIIQDLLQQIKKNPLCGGREFINNSSNTLLKITAENLSRNELDTLVSQVCKDLGVETKLSIGLELRTNVETAEKEIKIAVLFVKENQIKNHSEGVLFVDNSNNLGEFQHCSIKTTYNNEILDIPTFLRQQGVELISVSKSGK